MTEIFIVRHGNTFDTGDVVTRVGARTDLPLSGSGRAQAEALADHFQTVVPQGFSKAFCSPLARTKETATAILAKSFAPPTLETLEFLREVDYGQDENQPEDQVVARIGEAALKAWETEAVPPPGWQIDPAALRADWQELFQTLSTLQDSLPVLVVTSNGIARFLLDAVTVFEMKPETIKLKTGAYGTVRTRPGSTTLIDWNIRP